MKTHLRITAAVSVCMGEGGSKESECAMLVLRDGRWRIVSISVPK
jgi:hypothetical protein